MYLFICEFFPSLRRSLKHNGLLRILSVLHDTLSYILIPWTNLYRSFISSTMSRLVYMFLECMKFPSTTLVRTPRHLYYVIGWLASLSFYLRYTYCSHGWGERVFPYPWSPLNCLKAGYSRTSTGISVVSYTVTW